MIVALVMLAILAWGYWWLYHEIRPIDVVPAGGEMLRKRPIGLEDDTTAWQPSSGPWTALDEHQLIRLLTDSAPVERPTTDAADPLVDREDIP